jgi:hypothetical protein
VNKENLFLLPGSVLFLEQQLLEQRQRPAPHRSILREQGESGEGLPMRKEILTSNECTVKEEGATIRLTLYSPGLFFPETWRVTGCDPALLTLRSVQVANRPVYPPYFQKPPHCSKKDGERIDALQAHHSKGEPCDIAQENSTLKGVYVVPAGISICFVLESKTDDEITVQIVVEGQEVDASQLPKESTDEQAN